jgi:NhaP-type Na+/H+ or K+/H+ antiporter
VRSSHRPLAAITIARRLGVPRRLIVLIEGESLINDGTALVAYRTAVAAAVSGSFSLHGAGGDFPAQHRQWCRRRPRRGTGTAVDLPARPRRRPARHDDLAHRRLRGVRAGRGAGVSGVIAAVTVGVIVGHRASEHSTPSSRLKSFAFWEVLVFLLNALLFVLVGLQLPAILQDQDRSAGTLIGLGALAGAVVIGTRLIWSHTAPYLVRLLDRRPQQQTLRISWRPRMILAWGGLRGAVSLAAALALPAD